MTAMLYMLYVLNVMTENQIPTLLRCRYNPESVPEAI